MRDNLNLRKMTKMAIEVTRGDLYYADLSVGIGSEQGGLRPVLIIQNDMGNKYSNTVIAAAITSKNKKELPTHIELQKKFGLMKDSIILLEQIRTIDKSRLRNKIGHLDDITMNEVDRAITVSFGISIDVLGDKNDKNEIPPKWEHEQIPSAISSYADGSEKIDKIEKIKKTDNTDNTDNTARTGKTEEIQGETEEVKSMAAAFLDKLKRKNISANREKTKTRVREVWNNSPKENKHELLKFTGHGIYKTVTVTCRSGYITAKTAILFSCYLNINPFYLTGETDKREDYNDDMLKEFVTHLGYIRLWKEYEKYSQITPTMPKNAGQGKTDIEIIANNSKIKSEQNEQNEQIYISEKTSDSPVLSDSSLLTESTELSESSGSYELNISAERELSELIDVTESRQDIQSVIDGLTEEEILILMRAMLIRSKLKNTDISQLADKIKLLLMLN